MDDTSTALRSMSEDNARHVECLTAGRKSTAPLGRDGELVMLMREAELLECPRKLLDDVLEHSFRRSKGDRSFDLHLEHCWLARARDAANDHVVEGVSFTRSLKLDALDEDAGQSPRIR